MFGDNVLRINCNSKEYFKEKIDKEIIKKYLGGRGLGLYLIYKMGIKIEDLDPFDGKNPFIISSGPLTGTNLPLVTRAAAIFKSPLTDRWNYSTVGGTLGAIMRYAKVDILIITEKFDTPTYLFIENGNVEFNEAKNLWGKDTLETENILKKKYGNDSAIISIGPAGENLVLYSSINHEKWRQFGREGGGAVLGSKKIKAIVFKPSLRKVDIEDENKYEIIFKEIFKRSMGIDTKSYKENGTLGLIDSGNELGFFPSYYWDKVFLDDWKNISWKYNLKEKYYKGPGACLYCPVSCHREMYSEKYKKVYDLEYETTMALGGLTGINDPDEIIKLGELTDRMGLDSISLGNLLGFLIYLSKKGIINEKIDWGDSNKIEELILKIANKREEIGELGALGVKKLSEQLGVKDLAIHVKGLEPAGYDPRTLKGMILTYSVSERGADHLWSSGYAVDIPGKGGGRFATGLEKVDAVMDLEERNAIYDSALICKFGRGVYNWDTILNTLNIVTGFDLTIEELKNIAQRIIVLHRYLNKTNINDDKLPYRFFREYVNLPSPFEDGKCIISEEEWKNMISTYYIKRGYTLDGIPTIETLTKLNII